MGNQDVELTAAIKFETDGPSASGAKKALEDVKAGAEGAAVSVNKIKPAAGADKEFQKVQGSAEKSFAAIDASRQVTEGGLMGMGQVVKNLAGQFPALAAAMGPIGLILAGLAAWKKVVDTLTEAKAKLLAGIRQINLENTEAKIRRTAEAYDQERDSIDRLADARQRLSDLEQSKDDAQLRRQLAELELKHAQDKAMLSPDDSIGARKLDLDYAEKSGALKEASDQRRSERETTKLASALSDMLDQMKLAKDAVVSLSREFSDLSGQREKIKAQAMSGKLDWDKAAPEMAAIDKAQTDVAGKLKTALQNKADLETPIIEMRGRREVAELDRKTQGIQSQTRKTDNYVTGTGIDRDSNAQLDGLFNDLNAAASEGSSVFRNWARQQIEAKQRENALNAEFMTQMVDLANQNAQQIAAQKARATRL